MKLFVISEFRDEIDAFNNWVKNSDLDFSDSEIIHITFDLETRLFLENRGLTTKDTTEYFKKQDHQKSLQISKRIMSLMRNVFRLSDSRGISECYKVTYFFRFRSFLNYYILHSQIVKNIVDQEHPDMVIAFSSVYSKFSIDPDIKYRSLGDIVRIICQDKGVQYKIINNNPILNKIKLQIIFRKIIEIFSYPFTHLMYLSCLLFCKIKSNKKIAITHSKSQGMGKVVDMLTNSNDYTFLYMSLTRKDLITNLLKWLYPFNGLIASPKRIKGGKFKKDVNALLFEQKSLLNSIINKDNDLIYQSLRPLISLIENNMSIILRELNDKSKAIKKIIDVSRPKLIIAQHSVDITCILGEFSRILNVESMLISHGSHTPQTNANAKIEWSELGRSLMDGDYKYLAVQTPLAKQYLEQFPPKYSKPVVTGPLILSYCANDPLEKGKNRRKYLPDIKHKNIVVHAGTAKTRASNRFWIYETQDEFVNNINDIILAIEKMRDTYLIVRCRDMPCGLSCKTLSKLLIKSNCYGVYSDGEFQDYLIMADVLISYSSTTIEESLQSGIPVILYDPDNKYQHVSTSMINGYKQFGDFSPIIHVTNADFLHQRIRLAIDSNAYFQSKKIDISSYFKYSKKETTGRDIIF